MNITSETRREISRAIRHGLKTLERPEPLRLSQWAAENFYLSAESSYIEGAWEAIPYQVAIMDCMSNDDIRSVTMMKSARVGYTKMLVACIGYYAEHRRRNQVIWQPVDDDADDFVKDEIDPMLRDCVAVQRVFPYYNTKSKYNTLSKKCFRGSTLDIRGGKAAKNYRRLSKDVGYYDEVDGFDDNIENEGDPITLGDKRMEGATFPKSIRGSTPKIKGTSKIERAFDAADIQLRYHVPCPHCQTMQPLRWGAPDTPYGLKWHSGDPNTAMYQCEAAGCALFGYEDYLEHCLPRGRWTADDGRWIDEEGYFRAKNGGLIETPEHVAFHIWTAYSTMVTWAKLVREFVAAQKDKSKLQTFVNTTLGETWEEDGGERTEADVLFKRRERYSAQVPAGAQVVCVGIDTHDDRFELQFDGYGFGEERWTLDYVRLFGDVSRGLIWDKLAEALRRTFARTDGVVMSVALACQDSGGHFSDEVAAFSKRVGTRFLVPIKGANVYGKPVANMPREKNKQGVYLTEVGTDTAKSLLYQRYQIADDGPGCVHWPVADAFDYAYFEQLCAEERVKRWDRGVPKFLWDAKGRRNEATDCSVYSLAAVRILQQHYGLKFVEPGASAPEPTAQPRGRGVRNSGVLA